MFVDPTGMAPEWLGKLWQGVKTVLTYAVIISIAFVVFLFSDSGQELVADVSEMLEHFTWVIPFTLEAGAFVGAWVGYLFGLDTSGNSPLVVHSYRQWQTMFLWFIFSTMQAAVMTCIKLRFYRLRLRNMHFSTEKLQFPGEKRAQILLMLVWAAQVFFPLFQSQDAMLP